MTAQMCPREAEVTAAVRQRAWRAADDAVRGHAAGCTACAEAIAVCEALALEDEALRAEVAAHRALPSAGQVWHRATLRARAEGLEAAARPLVWGYGLAGAAVVGLTGAFVGPLVPSMLAALQRLVPRPAGAEQVAGWLESVLRAGLPFAAAAGACLALATVALYVAIRDDQKP